VRAVRLRLGEEQIELLQFLAPGGRPIPLDSRSNDRWFQHVAFPQTHKHPIFGAGRSICAQLGLRRSNPHSENLTSN